ncbi:MAG: hypothetical protein AAFZ52_17845, partial [Bacteroidota bacterium]
MIKKYSLVLLACLLVGTLSAQAVTRDIDKSFAAKEEVNVQQSHGPLTVEPSPNGKVRVVVRMSVEADDKAEAETFLTQLEAELRESGDRLDVTVGYPAIKSWNQNNRTTRVVFKDGTRVKNIRDFKLETTLYLPETDRLGLKIRFND